VKFGVDVLYIKLSSTRSVPGLSCWTCVGLVLLFSSRLAAGVTPVPKHVELLYLS